MSRILRRNARPMGRNGRPGDTGSKQHNQHQTQSAAGVEQRGEIRGLLCCQKRPLRQFRGSSRGEPVSIEHRAGSHNTLRPCVQYVDPLLFQLARDENDLLMSANSSSCEAAPSPVNAHARCAQPSTLASGSLHKKDASFFRSLQPVNNEGCRAARRMAEEQPLGSPPLAAADVDAQADARRRSAEKRDWAWVDGRRLLASVEAGSCQVRRVPSHPPASERRPLPPAPLRSRLTVAAAGR